MIGSTICDNTVRLRWGTKDIIYQCSNIGRLPAVLARRLWHRSLNTERLVPAWPKSSVVPTISDRICRLSAHSSFEMEHAEKRRIEPDVLSDTDARELEILGKKPVLRVRAFQPPANSAE